MTRRPGGRGVALGVARDGSRVAWGARTEVDVTAPAFRRHDRCIDAFHHTSRTDDGRRVWVAHNWSPRSVTVHPTAPFPHPELHREAWGVRIFEEETSDV